MRFMVIAGALALLSGCASTQQPATPQERDQAAKTFGLCILEKTHEMDDYTSPPETIARAVGAACELYRIQLTETITRGSDPRILYQTDINSKKMAFDAVLGVVLRERHNRQ